MSVRHWILPGAPVCNIKRIKSDDNMVPRLNLKALYPPRHPHPCCCLDADAAVKREIAQPRHCLRHIVVLALTVKHIQEARSVRIFYTQTVIDLGTRLDGEFHPLCAKPDLRSL